jgi:hypothetical protein
MSALTAAMLHPFVQKGAAWLDAIWPGWHARVVPAELRLESCKRCVLGQLTGDYTEALARFQLTGKDATLLGFTFFSGPEGCSTQEAKDAFEQLTQLWRQEVLHRRGKEEVPHA